MSNFDQNEEELNYGNDDSRLQCCVVWTQIPMLTWIFPPLGHVGICDSHGCVHDFQGSYMIGKGQMLFGNPRQRLILPIDPETLDNAIKEVSNEFKSIPFNIVCSNCHFYVASVLDRAQVKLPCGCCNKWTSGATAKVAWALVLKGRSLSVSDFCLTWIPFMILYGIIIAIIVLIKKAKM